MDAIRTDRGRYDNGKENPDAWRHPHLERHAGEQSCRRPAATGRSAGSSSSRAPDPATIPCFSARAFTTHARHESRFIRAGQQGQKALSIPVNAGLI
jgi:hypothetical protein